MSIKMIHAADLHMDSAFDALGARAAQRREEQRELLGDIVKLARERQVDLLLLAGDLLDSGSAYTETGLQLCSALSTLSCPVFISPGNHDYYCASSPYARLELPENVHVFKKAELDHVELPELGLRVWGAGYEDISCPPLLRGIHIEKKPGVLDICLIHGDVDKLNSSYCPITSREIADSGMNYIALGHIHSASGLQKAGDTWYAWPGCPEGRGFDETGEKGVYFVELEESSCTVEFIPTCRHCYEVVEVDVSRKDVKNCLPENTENDIYRIVLRGERDEAPNVQAVYEGLKDSFYALQIKDKTEIRHDIWEKAEQDSLTGLFLRRMKLMYDSAETEEEQRRITQSVRWGLAALEGREAVRAL